jgi:hypothetical protein
MEDHRRDAAEKEAVSRRATDVQVLEDAERLIAERAPGQTHADAVLANDRRRRDGRLLVSVGPLSGCHTTNAIDLRTLDRHRDAAVTSLIPALSCRSCRPNAPFAELVRLSRTSIADEMREEYRHRVLGD